MNPRPIIWTCPECSEQITVASHVSTRIAAPNTLAVEVAPDLADAWLHVWSHDPGGTSPASESED